jgi:arylsulfatase A-like enzyme
MDLTASMARVAGVTPPKERPFDGIDILRHVENGSAPAARPLFWRGRRGERTWRSARDGDLKFVSQQDGAKVQEWLFDLAKDPAEKNDLLASRGADVARLKKLLADWEREVKPVR